MSGGCLVGCEGGGGVQGGWGTASPVTKAADGWPAAHAPVLRLPPTHLPAPALLLAGCRAIANSANFASTAEAKADARTQVGPARASSIVSCNAPGQHPALGLLGAC